MGVPTRNEKEEIMSDGNEKEDISWTFPQAKRHCSAVESQIITSGEFSGNYGVWEEKRQSLSSRTLVLP